MSIQYAEKASKRVPLLVDEVDIDILYQSLNFFTEHLQGLGMDLTLIENLQQRLGEAEDWLIEEEEHEA